MERDELLRGLRSLAQLDTDAVQVYLGALEHVTDDGIRTELERFKGEHGYHAGQLSDAIERLGGQRPNLKIDLMGRVADWATTFRSMRGTAGALHAIRTAEHYHNRRYDEAATWQVDDEDITTMIRRFDADEKRHLAFVDEQLEAGVPVGRGEQ